MERKISFLLSVFVLWGTVFAPIAIAQQVAPAGEYGVHYVKYGDANLDEKVDAADALMALQYAVQKITLDDIGVTVLNANQDKEVNAADALMILKLSVGKLAEFPTGVYYMVKAMGEDIVLTGNYILDYDTSNSVNGVYERDITADTSFSVDIGALAPNTIYRISATAINDVDKARLVYSLQGLINRDFGMDENHTALVYILKDVSDNGWLTQITADGTIMQLADDSTGQPGMKEVRVGSWDEFYQIFSPVIRSCGLVLWDGNVPATANAAATVCGVDGYLPVLAHSPLHKLLVADGIPVNQSLADLFHNGNKGQLIAGTSIPSTGSAKNDTYLWALEKYFARCTATHLAYVQDGAIALKGCEAYPDHHVAQAGGSNHLSNHDYYIAWRCFVFDLAVNPNEAACDDPAQLDGQAEWGTDNDTLCKILQARYDRAKGAFGQFLGFVPWWSKYTTHNNQGSIAPSWVEWLLAEYITCYNMAKDAEVANTANHSVYYKYVPRQSQYQNNRPEEKVTYDPTVYYYTLYLGDYDSAGWLKDYVYSMWVQRGGDRMRGKLPLMWCFNPNLSYRVPMVFDYVYENRTEQDFFACGNSGAGYVMPSALVEGYVMPLMGKPRPAGNGDAVNAWAEYCKTFYQRFDLDITGFIINSSVSKVQPAVAECFNRFSPVGNLHNSTGTMLGIYEGTPYVYCQNGVSAQTESRVLYEHLTGRMSGYGFAAYRTVLATPQNVSRIVTSFNQYVEGKGFKIRYCDPYTFFDLIRQSGKGTVIT